jgi:hypothetical protein
VSEVPPARPAGIAAALVAATLAMVPTLAAQAAITQPAQPKHGPGGSDYAHHGVRLSSGGTGADAWYAFEPVQPRPEKAPVAIVMHGYGEFSGYASMEAFITHTVRRGTAVVYPRWQTGIAAPCPGPFNIEPCIASAVNGINGALAYLRSDPKLVRPELRKATYFGFSFGGIITSNMASRYRALGLPKPRAIFLDDPHDGGFAQLGLDEPALDDSLAGIPSKTLFQCHSGADGVLSEPGKATGSCNAVVGKLTSIPAKRKDLVLTHTDRHGEPPLSSAHGVCAGGPNSSVPDAYDWNFCWKVWDALRTCALEDRRCGYTLGDTRRHRSHGRWSDGVPVTPLTIQDAPPIGP